MMEMLPAYRSRDMTIKSIVFRTTPEQIVTCASVQLIILLLAKKIIIITSMARGQAFERVKAQWAGWPNLPAAAQGRIFIVDSNTLDRPTPRLVDGLELLYRLIHPELGSPR